MKTLSQVLSWLCTIAVARLLTPADYGLVGMAVVYLELITVINETGVGSAVVTKHTLTIHQIAQLNTLSVLLGVAGFLISCAAAIPLATFFGSPELRWVIPVISLASIVSAFRAVPSALLERELQFRSLAVAEGMQAIVGAVSVLVFALLGFRYWALVLGGLLGKTLWTGMVLSHRVHSFEWPRFRALREPLSFGWHVLVSRLAWYAQANADFVVAGRVFGQEVLGAYVLSFTIASAPTSKFTTMVGRVTFPFFSAIQDDPAALRRYLLSLTNGLALLTFPLALGLALVADHFVLFVLGTQWEAAIGPLRCLALLILFRALVPLLPQILNVTGDSRYVMRVGVSAAIILPIAFYAGSRWGILGVALTWITVYPLLTIPWYRRVFAKLSIPALDYVRVLLPALIASSMMAIAVAALRLVLPEQWPLSVRLAVQVGGGGAVYVLLLLTIFREHLHAFRRAVQIVRGTSR
jgi:O-antigen/teichoic acid export membrane protein